MKFPQKSKDTKCRFFKHVYYSDVWRGIVCFPLKKDIGITVVKFPHNDKPVMGYSWTISEMESEPFQPMTKEEVLEAWGERFLESVFYEIS